MSEGDFFAEQLRVTAEQLTWAAGQVPEARRSVSPGGSWSAARIIFHMLYYERETALPSMRLWLGGAGPGEDAFDAEGVQWEREGQTMPYEALLDAFSAVRAEEIALASQLVDLWDESRPTGWDMPGVAPITLRWVVSKTIQHTFEHSNELMRMSLFWDMMLAHHATEQTTGGE